MASSIALRRLANRNLLSGNIIRSLGSIPVANSATRSFNTNAQMTSRVEDDEYDNNYHRVLSRLGRDSPGFFSDGFDPFVTTRSVSQLMDQLLDTPYVSNTNRVGSEALRKGLEVREDGDALHLKVDMPGLGKEHVKVSVEENTLIIRGEGEKETEDEESRRKYSNRLNLIPNFYKVDGIKAEMKNGVLKVFVPKVKEDERKNVFQVNVD